MVKFFEDIKASLSQTFTTDKTQKQKELVVEVEKRRKSAGYELEKALAEMAKRRKKEGDANNAT